MSSSLGSTPTTEVGHISELGNPVFGGNKSGIGSILTNCWCLVGLQLPPLQPQMQQKHQSKNPKQGSHHRTIFVSSSPSPYPSHCTHSYSHSQLFPATHTLSFQHLFFLSPFVSFLKEKASGYDSITNFSLQKV